MNKTCKNCAKYGKCGHDIVEEYIITCGAWEELNAEEIAKERYCIAERFANIEKQLEALNETNKVLNKMASETAEMVKTHGKAIIQIYDALKEAKDEEK